MVIPIPHRGVQNKRLTSATDYAIIFKTIEAHLVKSIAHHSTRAARPCEKGANAEVCAVAGTLLAVWIRSTLLSQKCGALSSIQ